MAELNLSIEETEHHDKITLNWNVPDFQALYDASEEDRTKIAEKSFTVRGEIWKFSMKQCEEENVSIFLNFYGSGCMVAEYDVFLKSSTGEFINTLKPILKKHVSSSRSNIEGAGRGWGEWDWQTLSNLQNKGFLVNDELHLRMTVNIYSLNHNALLKNDFSTDFKKALDSGEGSDVIFSFVEGEGSETVVAQIKAHRLILSLRSSVFATMFASGMKEAMDGEVRICDMSPKSMKILLDFVYSGEVDPEWKTVVEELIYGADKFQLDQLKDFLCRNIYSALTPANIWEIRRLASLYKLSQVLKTTMKFFRDKAEDVVENLENHHVLVLKEDES